MEDKKSVKEKCNEVIDRLATDLHRMGIKYEVLFNDAGLKLLTEQALKQIDFVLEDSPIWLTETISREERIKTIHLHTYCLARDYDAKKLSLLVDFYFGAKSQQEFKELIITTGKSNLYVDTVFKGNEMYITSDECKIWLELKKKYNDYAVQIASLFDDSVELKIDKQRAHVVVDVSNIVWIKKISYLVGYGESYSYPINIWKQMKDSLKLLEERANEDYE